MPAHGKRGSIRISRSTPTRRFRGGFAIWGLALGFDVHVAANDRAREYAGSRLGDGCCDDLPPAVRAAAGADAIRLIDVLWVARTNGQVVAAFEVEHSTPAEVRAFQAWRRRRPSP